jgi:hypothetical protein
MRYPSPAHVPRSTNWHRSEQNGLKGFAAELSDSLLQIGQRMRLCSFRFGCLRHPAGKETPPHDGRHSNPQALIGLNFGRVTSGVTSSK